ncbi:anti-sigma factor [Mucilaginibacter sp.]
MEEFVKTYIESGILELYVTGSLSAAGQQEVERMAVKHPEVRSELQAIEAALQTYAEEQGVEPSENLKSRILNSLITNLGNDHNLKGVFHNDSSNGKVVAITAGRKTVFYKYAFAASFLLLCLSIAALAMVYSNLQKANGQLFALQTQNQRYSNTVKYDADELDVYRSNAYKLVTLRGVKKSPASSINLAFSPAKKKVMLSLNHMNLPANDKAHQYQLWALVNGKPVDLGVFDAQTDTTDQGMIEMKSIAAADAFAVTLEPRGGSQSPTLTEMMVMAKL